MSAEAELSWQESNQRYLMDALAEVRKALERCIESSETESSESKTGNMARSRDEFEGTAATERPALEILCRAFGLSPFERGILLMCAGVELDSSFASLCAKVQGDPQRAYPTFSLALSSLEGAHWSALTPGGPLRHWRMIEADIGSRITLSPLRIDERILHYLTGINQLDERLAGFVEPLAPDPPLAPSHAMIAEKMRAVLSESMPEFPAIQLCGPDADSHQSIAAAACAEIGLNLHRIPARILPAAPAELDALERLWEREAALSYSALLLDCSDLDSSDVMHERAVAQFIERARGVIIINSNERKRKPRRLTVTFDVQRPGSEEQHAIWMRAVNAFGADMSNQANLLASHFDLGPGSIQAALADALPCQASEDLGQALWNACKAQARTHLDELAGRIDPAATWEDLVLPKNQIQVLRQIASQVRNRARVYGDWGFASKGQRGLGISALFSGSSGTGKTMAAEVLAGELGLDLYRIDLSQVVSKYIGETEKNLRRVFDAAESGGAVLLFDEADALFGKRSEVRDSHDRYANVEISYLLQRMESYRGLAILTTNMKEALDKAFLRRIRFLVQFPFPDASMRAEIWSRIFPESTPTAGLDIMKLSRLNVSGGNIRNIALGAAFMAADGNEPVRMTHLLRAARAECEKIEKPMTESEIGGWV